MPLLCLKNQRGAFTDGHASLICPLTDIIDDIHRKLNNDFPLDRSCPLLLLEIKKTPIGCPFALAEYPHQNPNSVPTRSRQVRLSASHVDSCRSRPVYHRTHTRRLQMYQSGVSANHGLLDRHDGTAKTMPSSVRGSALAFAVQQSGYSQGFLLFVLPAHQAAV